MRELPPFLSFFPLSLIHQSRSSPLFPPPSSTLFFPSFLPFASFSLSLFLLFQLYHPVPFSILFVSSSNHLPPFSHCLCPSRFLPQSIHASLIWFQLALSCSLPRCFVPFNSDRPFAKCAKRNLMGKRVKKKRRKKERTRESKGGKKEEKGGGKTEKRGTGSRKPRTRWLDN